MCGRYALYGPKSRLREHFDADFDGFEFRPRYNIAPMQDAPVILQVEDERVASLMRWGLLPSWAKDPTIAARLINARAETAAEKPSFRSAMKARRCLVPVDGFYEWAKVGDAKQPYFIRAANDEPLALAGLWEHWTSPVGESIQTFTILTTEANDLIRPLHERMPVVLPPEVWNLWLRPSRTPAQLQPLLEPLPAGLLKLHPVAKRVGNARNDDADLVEPATT